MRKINTNTNDIKFPDSMTKTATGVASLWFQTFTQL
jgi:hypothetical protein